MDYAINHRRALMGKRPLLGDNIKTVLAVIALFAAYALVGTMEYNDATEAANEARITVCRSN